MSKRTLSPSNSTVVHAGKTRTRLRIPRAHRKDSHLKHAESAIASVPGVRQVEINRRTGSILISHNENPAFLDHLTEALADEAPELLAILMTGDSEAYDAGWEALTRAWKRWLEPDAIPVRRTAGNGGGEAEDAQVADFAARSSTFKKALPAAFIASGAWKLLRGQALTAGTAPLAMFYYGFDLYWKLQQENLAHKIEKATGGLPELEQHFHQPTKEHL